MPHLVMVDVSAVEKNGKDVEHVQFAIKNKTKPTDSKIAIQLLYVFCVDLMSQEMINIDNGLLPFFLPSSKHQIAFIFLFILDKQNFLLFKQIRKLG